MNQEASQFLNRLPCVLRSRVSAQFVLFGFRKNRASYSVRSSLIQCYGYESVDDRTDDLARYSLTSEPLMDDLG